MLPMYKLRVPLALLLGTTSVSAEWGKIKGSVNLEAFPEVFRQQPPDTPAYMIDNTDNWKGVAPINGEYNGPVWHKSGSFENYMQKLHVGEDKAAGAPRSGSPAHSNSTFRARQSAGYWLPELAPLGKAPHAGDGYVFYRNVLDYKADNTGATNTEEAINAAIEDGERCGETCGNTFVKGALIYFPGGTYKICTPIIQMYYTQFVGDPHDRPIIKGCGNFTGIALIDVDPYVPNQAQPDGTGINWYINQNQFFRQIRNFVFDMTEMPSATDEHGQALVPTGIHWQVSQATSLQNLLFKMPKAEVGTNVTHVGIFTENGSGGFVSDLEFEGGAIGWRVGSQQYTAIGLKFTNCITAVQMIWNWGFNWQKIDVDGGTIAFNISGRDGIDGQGIGSVSIIDSTIRNVPVGILTNAHAQSPNIVIDNTAFENVGVIVKVNDGTTLLDGGSQVVNLWAHGRRYNGGIGKSQTGPVEGRPPRSERLLDGGKLFTRLRPQYEDLPASKFLIATEHGCDNLGTRDNTAAINAFLKKAAAGGMIAYFPAGIYPIHGTVTIPTGSKVQGTSWSQIQATGSYFQDINNPKVAVRVGEAGDVGTMEIVDMLFTVKGNTAGAIMMEWNVHESFQGSAAMWDSHIRVGGGIGTDLDVANCPKLGYNEACICVFLLLHVTNKASGYFENVWAWVADHDNDMSLYWEVDSSASQISLYGGRGMLIESQGPCWFYGTGSEHVVLYQYQTYKAKDIYLGHIQTESPYFQPKPPSPKPFESSLGFFESDPDFADCTTDSCREAWGLRVIDSEGVTVHSAGLYSWFSNYEQSCLESENCQGRIMQVKGSKDVAIYNIFSKGVKEIATGEGYTIGQEDNQRGYTSEISVWFPQDDLPIVYIGTEVYQTPTAACPSPCIMVLAPSRLSGNTTISISPYTTSLEVGSTTTTLVLTPKPVTTDRIAFSNINVTGTITDGVVFNTITSVVLELVEVVITVVTNGQTTTTTRKLQLPPWPQITNGPPDKWTSDIAATRNGTTIGGPVIATISTDQPEETSTTSEPLPVWTKFPPIMIVEPITEEIESQCSDDECPADEEDGDSIKVKCDELWFFVFCVNIEHVKVFGWKLRFPKGIMGPGPASLHFIPRLDGWFIKHPTPLPPWPRVTIGPGMKYPKKDPSCDDNKLSVPVEMYTRSYGLSMSNGVTVTTTTRTITETIYETGCPVPEYTSTESCTIRAKRTALPSAALSAIPTVVPISRRADDPAWAEDWSCPGEEEDTIIYLTDDYEDTELLQILDRLLYDQRNFGLRFTVFSTGKLARSVVFFYVWDLPESLRQKYAMMAGIALCYVWKTHSSTGTPARELRNETARLHERAQTEPDRHRYAWYRSQISSYPGESWAFEGVDIEDDFYSYYEYYRDSTEGEGQTIYLLEDGINEDDPAYVGATIEYLPGDDSIDRGNPDRDHGDTCAKLLVARDVGLVRKAKLVTNKATDFTSGAAPYELLLVSLLQMIEHIDNSGSKGKCVVSMSFFLGDWDMPMLIPEFGREFKRLLKLLEENLGCVLVTSAGNDGNLGEAERRLPRGWRYSGELPNLVVAGATGKNAARARLSSLWSSGGDEGMTYAPGIRVEIPRVDGRSMDPESGTSLSAPLISGLVAYLRGLDSPWKEDFKTPATVVKMVNYLSRVIEVTRDFEGGSPIQDRLDNQEDLSYKPRIIWNGNVERENCLTGYTSDKAKAVCDDYIGKLPDNLANWVPDQIPDACRRGLAKRGSLNGRAVCEIGGDGITWKHGEPSPTCTAECGTLCTGYYCVPRPSGPPPDFGDPINKPAVPTTTPGPEFPGLPRVDGPYSGPECSRYTTSTVCNGSGGRSACGDQVLCVPTAKSQPTYSPHGTCTGEGKICIRSTVYQCVEKRSTRDTFPSEQTVMPRAQRSGPSAAVVTGAAPPLSAPVGKTRRQDPSPVPAPEPAPVAPLQPLLGRQNNNSDSLLPRQELRCDYIPACLVCGTITRKPCLEASIYSHTGGASGTEVTARLFEDGKEVCTASTHCKILEQNAGNCDGVVNFDCGGGYRMNWKFNHIEYYSNSYKGSFAVSLARTVSDKLVFCIENAGARLVPAVCIENEFRYRGEMCR